MENLTQRLRKLKLDIRIGMEEKQINQDLGIILLDNLETTLRTPTLNKQGELLLALEDLKYFARNNCREWNVEELESILDRL